MNWTIIFYAFLTAHAICGNWAYWHNKLTVDRERFDTYNRTHGRANAITCIIIISLSMCLLGFLIATPIWCGYLDKEDESTYAD